MLRFLSKFTQIKARKKKTRKIMVIKILKCRVEKNLEKKN